MDNRSVTVFALFKQFQHAYEQYQSDNIATGLDADSFESWRTKKEETHHQFQFSSQILTFELLILVFVRSIRETIFELYREALSGSVSFFFPLDHANYARWLPVHLRDMALLDTKHSEMALEFKNGNFAVIRLNGCFQPLQLITPINKTIKVLKGEGGAVGLT